MPTDAMETAKPIVNSSSAILVNNLTKYYGDLLAVDHISFTVHRGEVFGFLGPNGAGKTTTQRMLTTLLEPTEGSIVVNGHDLARDAYPVKRQMGLVPEESNVYTELTCAGYLTHPCELLANEWLIPPKPSIMLIDPKTYLESIAA